MLISHEHAEWWKESSKHGAWLATGPAGMGIDGGTGIGGTANPAAARVPPG